MYLWEVKSPKESKGAWDYLQPVATIPAEQAFQPLSQSKCDLQEVILPVSGGPFGPARNLQGRGRYAESGLTA
jgi:hypothetical protein